MGIFFPVNDENETPGEKGIYVCYWTKTLFISLWNEFHFQKLITFFPDRIFGFKINSTLKLVFILIFFPFSYMMLFFPPPDKNEKKKKLFIKSTKSKAMKFNERA